MIKTKSEILFYYESRRNPNGDPGFENMPRQMPNETIVVTDVRIKRTIRDHAKKVRKENKIFVDFREDGKPDTPDEKLKEILDETSLNEQKDYIPDLLEKTFDTPLFGALVTIRKGNRETDGDDGKRAKKGTGQSVTGTLQFGIARSVNKVDVHTLSITSKFTGDESKGREPGMGRIHYVDYALIKVHGIMNPDALYKYSTNEKIIKNFEHSWKLLPEYLWDGTNHLNTQSKSPQKSILYIQVNYDNKLYNDLVELVDENNILKEGKPTSRGKSPFVFEKLANTLNERKNYIKSIEIRAIRELRDDIVKFISKLDDDIDHTEIYD
jgi:Cas7 group CRISPR-associated protein Csh2